MTFIPNSVTDYKTNSYNMKSYIRAANHFIC